jgi:DNA-binding NtrC family response regulator
MEQAVRVLNPPRLLLADDDDDLREMLAGVLRLDGYKVLEARDGTELLRHIVVTDEEDGTVEPVDLIITDVRMPGWSGLQVLSGVRRKDWAIPVMLITAYGDHDTEEEAQRLGVAAFFRKPFDLDDLRTAVANVLPYQPPARHRAAPPTSP